MYEAIFFVINKKFSCFLKNPSSFPKKHQMVDDAGVVGRPWGALEPEAVAASVEDLAAASGTEFSAGVGVGVKVGLRRQSSKLMKARPRTRSGSLSPHGDA